MYTDGQIIVNTELKGAGYTIVATSEDVLNQPNETNLKKRWWFKLTPEQVAFQAANPDADITETIACQLGKFTFDKAKEIKLAEIEQADTDAERFNVNGVTMWLDKETRTSLISITIPAYEKLGRTHKVLWADGANPVSFDVPLALLKELLMQLEVYASEVHDNTCRLKNELSKMLKPSELEAFQIADYPEPLTFTL